MAKQIYLTKETYDSFIDLVITSVNIEKDRARFLSFLKELLNAVIVETNDDLPMNIVGVSSLVEYKDLDTGISTHQRLFFPIDADEKETELSVLSPTGMALLGHKVGDKITIEGSRDHKQIIISKID